MKILPKTTKKRNFKTNPLQNIRKIPNVSGGGGSAGVMKDLSTDTGDDEVQENGDSDYISSVSCQQCPTI